MLVLAASRKTILQTFSVSFVRMSYTSYKRNNVLYVLIESKMHSSISIIQAAYSLERFLKNKKQRKRNDMKKLSKFKNKFFENRKNLCRKNSKSALIAELSCYLTKQLIIPNNAEIKL